MFLMKIKLYEIIGNHFVVASHEIRLGLIQFIIKFMLRRKLQAHPELNVSYFKGDFQLSLKFEAKGLKTISVPSYLDSRTF